MNPELIDTSECAAILQVTPQAARTIAKKAGVKSVRRGRGCLFFYRADIERLASERGGKVGPGRPRKKIQDIIPEKALSA